MNGNGNGALAALATRLAELETAHRVVLQHLEERWAPRLLALERDVDRLAAELAALTKK